MLKAPSIIRSMTKPRKASTLRTRGGCGAGVGTVIFVLRGARCAKPQAGGLATDSQSGSLQHRFDLVARDPGEIPRDRVLERTRRDAEIERLLQIAVEQAVK